MKSFCDNLRAQRRHHASRLKKKRACYWGGQNWLTPEERIRRIGRIYRTPAPCSCAMCGNPRKFFHEDSIQERRWSQRERVQDLT